MILQYLFEYTCYKFFFAKIFVWWNTLIGADLVTLTSLILWHNITVKIFLLLLFVKKKYNWIYEQFQILTHWLTYFISCFFYKRLSEIWWTGILRNQMYLPKFSITIWSNIFVKYRQNPVDYRQQNIISYQYQNWSNQISISNLVKYPRQKYPRENLVKYCNNLFQYFLSYPSLSPWKYPRTMS